MRIYIAGPMAGIPDFNIGAFAQASFHFRERGHFVVNPVKVARIYGTDREVAESFDTYSTRPDLPSAALAARIVAAELDLLSTCDAIYLLRGWENSVGARRELAVALKKPSMIIMLEGAEGTSE